MTDLATIKNLRNEHFKDMFVLGDIVSIKGEKFGYICDFWNNLIRVNDGDEVKYYNSSQLKRITSPGGERV